MRRHRRTRHSGWRSLRLRRCRCRRGRTRWCWSRDRWCRWGNWLRRLRCHWGRCNGRRRRRTRKRGAIGDLGLRRGCRCGGCRCGRRRGRRWCCSATCSRRRERCRRRRRSLDARTRGRRLRRNRSRRLHRRSRRRGGWRGRRRRFRRRGCDRRRHRLSLTLVDDRTRIRRFTARHAPRIERVLTARQDLRLLDPVLLLDATLEAQHLADLGDVLGLPCCDVGVTTHACLVERRLERPIDRPDALEIVGRATCGGRGDRRGNGRGRRRHRSGRRGHAHGRMCGGGRARRGGGCSGRCCGSSGGRGGRHRRNGSRLRGRCYDRFRRGRRGSVTLLIASQRLLEPRLGRTGGCRRGRCGCRHDGGSRYRRRRGRLGCIRRRQRIGPAECVTNRARARLCGGPTGHRHGLRRRRHRRHGGRLCGGRRRHHLGLPARRRHPPRQAPDPASDQIGRAEHQQRLQNIGRHCSPFAATPRRHSITRTSSSFRPGAPFPLEPPNGLRRRIVVL